MEFNDPPRIGMHFRMSIQGRRYKDMRPDGYVKPDYSAYHADMLDNPNFAIDAKGCSHLGHGFHHFTEFISPLRNAQPFDEIESKKALIANVS